MGEKSGVHLEPRRTQLASPGELGHGKGRLKLFLVSVSKLSPVNLSQAKFPQMDGRFCLCKITHPQTSDHGCFHPYTQLSVVCTDTAHVH